MDKYIHPGTLLGSQGYREPAVCCYRGEEAAWHISVPVEGQAEENDNPKGSMSLCAEVVHGHCTSTPLCFLYLLTLVLFHWKSKTDSLGLPCPSLVLIKDLSCPVLLTSLTRYLPEAPLSQDISLTFFTPWHLKKGQEPSGLGSSGASLCWKRVIITGGVCGAPSSLCWKSLSPGTGKSWQRGSWMCSCCQCSTSHPLFPCQNAGLVEAKISSPATTTCTVTSTWPRLVLCEGHEPIHSPGSRG